MKTVTDPEISGASIPVSAGSKLKQLFDELMEEPLPPGLYLVATPIGNLGDISPRALSVLARADVVFCEDTRHSRKLFSAFGIRRQLLSYHDHSSEADEMRALARLQSGQSAALISDAGTPLMSDPGFRLARKAIELGIKLYAIPGPAAAAAALMVSGLPSIRVFFEGFLPSKAEARRKRLLELAPLPATLIFYEAANRLQKTLSDMASIFAGREAALARELTKIYEETFYGRFPEFAHDDKLANVKGEIVLMIGPPPKGPEASDADINACLDQALASMSVRDAVDEVAKALGTKRKRVYDLANARKKRR